MSMWAAAYDLPHLADPGKKIAWLPTLEGSFGKHADVFREEGSITLPSAYDRMAELLHIDPDDHSNDVGSVIHLFKRGVVGADGLPNVVGSFVTERRPDDLKSKATSTTELSGRGLTAYFLDRVSLWPYDYPNNPTNEGDWIYGGDNILTNPGFEDGSPQSEQWGVWLDDGVTSGSWRVVVDGDPTANIAYNATASDVKDAIELGVVAIISVTVTGTGTEDDPFIISVTDPTGNMPLSIEDVSLSGGSINSERLRVGGSPDINGWTKNISLTRQSMDHSTYASDGFRLTESGEPVHTGSYALRINGLTKYAGPMQVVNVKPGHRYTGSIWVWSSSSTNIFRLVIRDRFEGFIGGPDGLGGFTVTPSTWTEVSYEFVVPDDVTQIVFRFAVVSDTVDGLDVNPIPFYVDDASLAPGTAATTIGDIWEQLLLDAQTDHDGEGRDALSFLVPTFTDTVDSNGDPWDTNRRVTLSVDDTYGQIAESFQNLWKYVHRIYYDREDDTYYFEVFNPGYVEEDHSTTDTGTLTIGMNILGGEMVERSPEGTHFTARGDGDIWADAVDSNLLAAWGWADAKTADVPTADASDLADVVTQQMVRNLEQMFSFQAEMNDQSQVRPFHEIDVLHKVGVNLGASSDFPFQDMVITSIVTSFRPGHGPQHQVYVNSDAFASTGAAALAEAVRRLLRRTQRTEQDYGGLAFQAGGGSGTPTVVIACYNASSFSQAAANVILTGTDDHVIIQEIIEALDGLAGGRILITEGDFYVDLDYIDSTACSGDIHFLGMNRWDTTVCHVQSGTDGDIFTMDDDDTFEDISFGSAGAV